MATAEPAQRGTETVAASPQTLMSVRGLGIRLKTPQGGWQAIGGYSVSAATVGGGTASQAVYPASGSGSSQQFVFTFPGVANPGSVNMLINSAVMGGDVLHGVHVVRNPTVLPLPTDVSRWDPHMVRIGRRWYVAFVESPSQNPFVFHPALARGPSTGAFGDFTLVGRDTARTMTEGMVMQKIGGTWYVLCSSSRDEGGPDAGRYRIYDLKMNFLGFLNAPYPTNIPHPMVFPVPDTATRTTSSLGSAVGAIANSTVTSLW